LPVTRAAPYTGQNEKIEQNHERRVEAQKELVFRKPHKGNADSVYEQEVQTYTSAPECYRQFDLSSPEKSQYQH
jgi:hypothetical protein